MLSEREYALLYCFKLVSVLQALGEGLFIWGACHECKYLLSSSSVSSRNTFINKDPQEKSYEKL